MRYAKKRETFLLKDLKNDFKLRRKYSSCYVYSLSFPCTFFCWFVYKSKVVFFKRPQWLHDSTLIHCVTIETDSIATSKRIASNLTYEVLKRVFSKCKGVIL